MMVYWLITMGQEQGAVCMYVCEYLTMKSASQSLKLFLRIGIKKPKP